MTGVRGDEDFLRMRKLKRGVGKEFLQHGLITHPNGMFRHRVGPSLNDPRTGAARFLNIFGQRVGGRPGERRGVLENDDGDRFDLVSDDRQRFRNGRQNSQGEGDEKEHVLHD